MTIREAKCAMAHAPRDEMSSLVNPKFTRKQLAANADTVLGLECLRTHLEPDEVKMVCAIVQDCPNPVPLHFAYQQDGGLTVGWNRDELDRRKLRIEQQRVLLDGIYKKAYYTAQPTRRSLKTGKTMMGLKKRKREPKKPEEDKPDPTSPKFVLKRPKL